MTGLNPPAFLAPSAWHERGQLTEWNGHSVFFITQGEGETLLLLHGFPTSSWDWQHVWGGLAKAHRVVAFDYVGYGFSSKPKDGPYSIGAYADQAEAVLRKLGVEKAHLLAHDLGDTVAQELMARALERKSRKTPGGLSLQSVCMLNGGVLPELHRPRALQRLLDSPLGGVASRLITRKRFERALAEVFGPRSKPSPWELDGFWECVSRDQGLRNYHRLIGYMRERKEHRGRWVAPLLDETTPIGFINGLADPVSGAHVVEGLRQLRPSLPIHTLPDIGHYPQTEAPEAVLAAYRDFRAGRG